MLQVVGRDFVSGMDGPSSKDWQEGCTRLKHSKQSSVIIYSPLAAVSL
jgi:hypothetical protein